MLTPISTLSMSQLVLYHFHKVSVILREATLIPKDSLFTLANVLDILIVIALGQKMYLGWEPSCWEYHI